MFYKKRSLSFLTLLFLLCVFSTITHAATLINLESKRFIWGPKGSRSTLANSGEMNFTVGENFAIARRCFHYFPERSCELNVFDSHSGERLFKLEPRGGTIAAIANNRAIVNGVDGVNVYSLEYGEKLYTIQIPNEPKFSGMTTLVHSQSIIVSNDTIFVAKSVRDYSSNEFDHSIYYFDLETGQKIGSVRLQPEDPAFRLGSLAVDNNIIAVGSSYDNDKGPASGAVYIFDISTGEQISKLYSPDETGIRQRFGRSLAISEGVVVVGENSFNNGRRKDIVVGSVYVIDPISGDIIDSLVPSNEQGALGFGMSISAYNDVISVGAFRETIMPNRIQQGRGAIYLFDIKTGLQIDKILGPRMNSEIGNGLEIYDNRIITSRSLRPIPLFDSIGFLTLAVGILIANKKRVLW